MPIQQNQIQDAGTHPSHLGLENYGIRHVNTVYWNLGAVHLIERAIQRREGHLSKEGALVVRTGQPERHNNRLQNFHALRLRDCPNGKWENCASCASKSCSESNCTDMQMHRE